ncbi:MULTISPECIES: GtrA family protein [Ramlibacter]|uniref:GtrA family protein n=1 Tax=Ramlibacter aquaticus TaxID=2780094 RepID=A0ABR9SIP5_9BURK|nr:MULTISPECIES: GtrA family protein [Ramlibacter]MBE7942223.1 GtrA family protein [Ramlibacter aquaticus]
MLSAQFVRFVVAGGLAAAANYGSRFLFSVWLPYALAITCAYLVGMTVAFLLMRKHVFSAVGQPLLPQVVKFAVVNLFALVQTLVVSLVLARWGLPALGVRQHVESIAHLVGVVVPVFTSFVGHRQLTFRRSTS